MERPLRFLGIGVPIIYLIAMSAMMERMFPGWAAYFYSFDKENISDRLFLVPIVIFVAVAWKVPRHWLAYLLIVQLLIFVPTLLQMVQMLGKDRAHPWLGLGGFYHLAWMLVALIAGFVGRWFWSQFKKRSV
ncbi:hypothetical protein MNBD_ALPHA04-1627 [hydrothermal vent metagenome]|uniref:Uncharacterized protein n=1 Tax=hydrothermal vent metagenome TaxID=652676 RepID=A0A3B0RU76_9ZZZZ